MFHVLLGQYHGQAEYKTASCSLRAISCTHRCTRRELKYKLPAAERNNWHGFGFQAFTVLFNSNYRNFKPVRGMSRTPHHPSPPHPHLAPEMPAAFPEQLTATSYLCRLLSTTAKRLHAYRATCHIACWRRLPPHHLALFSLNFTCPAAPWSPLRQPEFLLLCLCVFLFLVI